MIIPADEALAALMADYDRRHPDATEFNRGAVEYERRHALEDLDRVGLAVVERPRRCALMVAVFRSWDPVPTFHAYSDRVPATVDLDDGRRGWDMRTRCGRVTYATSWVPGPERGRPSTDYRQVDHADRMRLDHAALIGRPCSTCYPVGVR